MLYKDVLEMDLDQHKETIADITRELAEKTSIIEAQDVLLACAGEEAQDLANTNAEKEQMILTLQELVETSNPNDTVGKKRKIAF